jgi:hypothetical protein
MVKFFSTDISQVQPNLPSLSADWKTPVGDVNTEQQLEASKNYTKENHNKGI